MENALVHASATLVPAMTVRDAAERYNTLVDFIQTVMVKDQDYGTIPGVAKPCLYKAGAEKMLTLFGLAPAFSFIERVEDWTGRDHGGEPFFYFLYKCQLMRGGEIVGEGDGSCNSWEKKYRYRRGERVCPKCGKSGTVIVGKEEYGGGFICFAKKGGCGAKFRSTDTDITSQVVADVPNPDIAEQVNTLLKMAQKRSLVAAVLIACNASALFTQDMEDMRVIEIEPERPIENYDEVSERLLREAKEKLAKTRPEPPPTFMDPPAGLDDGHEPPGGWQGANRSHVVEMPDQRHAAQQAEAAAVIEEAEEAGKPKRKPAKSTGLPFKAMNEIKKLKTEMRQLTGSDQIYYDFLQAAGVAHSNELTTPAARVIYKALDAALNRLRGGEARKAAEQERRNELTKHWERVGDKAFFDVLGAHSFESIDDLLARSKSSDVEDAVLADLKAIK